METPGGVQRLGGMVNYYSAGSSHIHGELLKLGIAIGETSVAKYTVRQRNRPRRLGAPS